MVLSMKRWAGRTAIVTGASSGCGAAIVKMLIQNGIIVVGLARRVERIEQLAKELCTQKLFAIRCDVSDPGSIVDAFKQSKKLAGPVSILINNAGIAQPTNLIDGDEKQWAKILATNVLGLQIATREAIRQMDEVKITDGQIIHISSCLGHYVVPLPNLNMYPASKHAIRALTETLRIELIQRNSKIRIGCISPGPINTEFADANDLYRNPGFAEEFRKLPKLEADDVADATNYILSTPGHVQVHDIILRPIGALY